ncbi:MAG TPA: D-alanyl-D-alanine carboxypeptidase [Actinomycetota bacterium]|nr:D-alanyl-D-alanine carboxypeptidase [Actinomycetota bacterium]
MRRTFVGLLILLVLCASAPLLWSAPAHARPNWTSRLDRIIAGHKIGVALHDDGRVLYGHDAKRLRVPASNEKLLLSMALFEAIGPQETLDTRLFSTATPTFGILSGDLWLASEGDPTLGADGERSRSLPFAATDVRAFVDLVRDAGITEITGRVYADVSYFERDWFAPGWKANFPHRYIPLPSAVTFEGNVVNGHHIDNPEWRAARALTEALEAAGVDVGQRPRAGILPANTTLLGSLASQRLAVLVRYMNRSSSNFFAEVLGKRLGAETYQPPGTIAKGANAIEAFGASVGVDLTAHDSSGLSYKNRVSARGIVRMLTHVELTDPWYPVLRRGLPKGGQGTLEDRLHGIPLRAKTGSLAGISALSGWLRLSHTGEWAEFSILSRGLSYQTAKGLEDRIVRLMHAAAR